MAYRQTKDQDRIRITDPLPERPDDQITKLGEALDARVPRRRKENLLVA